MTYQNFQRPGAAVMAVDRQTYFNSLTVIAAGVAAVTTSATIAITLPAWAMLLGWVAFSIGGQTTRDGLANIASFILGLLLGAATSLAVGRLTPVVGKAAIPVAIFGVALAVTSLRAVRPIHNPLPYVFGLVCFFAYAEAPSASHLAVLAAAGIFGAAGAWTVSFLQSFLLAPP